MEAETPAAMRPVSIVALGRFEANFTKIRRTDDLWAINQAGDHWGFEPDLTIAMDDLERDWASGPEYVEQVCKHGPVLAAREFSQFPNVSAYPVKDVARWLEETSGVDPRRLLDNTCNYAIALALMQNRPKITLYGFDWCAPDDEADLAAGLCRWAFKGYETAPEWFKYYDKWVIYQRRATEPGSEAFHFLLGLAAGLGRYVHFAAGTTCLNADRDKYFYGYQEQPEI